MSPMSLTIAWGYINSSHFVVLIFSSLLTGDTVSRILKLFNFSRHFIFLKSPKFKGKERREERSRTQIETERERVNREQRGGRKKIVGEDRRGERGRRGCRGRFEGKF